MRILSLSIIGLLTALSFVALAPKLLQAQPSVTTLGQSAAGAVEEVGYRYRSYRYARRPHYRPYYKPYYRPYYRPYAYHRPYYQPYYRPYSRPGVSLWFGF